jgi:hypothetical protein
MPRLVVAVAVAVAFALGQRPGHEALSRDWQWGGGGSGNSGVAITTDGPWLGDLAP